MKIRTKQFKKKEGGAIYQINVTFHPHLSSSACLRNGRADSGWHGVFGQPQNRPQGPRRSQLPHQRQHEHQDFRLWHGETNR